MLLTGLAWGVAWTPNDSAGGIVRLTLLYVFAHFLASSLAVAAAAFFLVGRLLGPGIAGLPGRRRQQGLFVPPAERETLEFGYCFDVSCPGMKRGRRENPRGGSVVGLMSGIGFYTCVLSGLGAVVRGAVRAMAGDHAALLVGSSKLGHGKGRTKARTGYRYSSETQSTWLRSATTL